MTHRPSPAPRRVLLALACLVPLLTGACGSVRSLLPRPAVIEGQPWVLPESVFPSQRLYRLRYEDRVDRVDLKLALYLESRERFRLQTTADLGRKLWTLEVEGDEALWIDHREATVCRTARAGELRIVPLGGLPVVAVPRVLLGLLPMPPAEPPRRPPEEASLAYDDAFGRTWNAGFEATPPEGDRWGAVRWWSLVEAGEPTVWWRWHDGAAVLVDEPAGRQLRWGELAREMLASPLGPPQVPAGYAEVACGVAD